MKPEKVFRAGLVSASVWKNEKKDVKGTPREYKTITFERSYKDKEDEWQKTSSLSVNDIPRAVTVLQQAFEYLTLREEIKEEVFA